MAYASVNLDEGEGPLVFPAFLFNPYRSPLP